MDYLVSLRQSALAILNAGRAWDGGLFEAFAANHLLIEATVNKTFDRSILVSDVKSTFFSGGTLTAFVFTIILVVFLLGIVVVSIVLRCMSSSQQSQFGKKLQVRVKNLNRQLPVPLRSVFGLVCVILLALTLIPLVLAFATNSRLHATIAESDTKREGSVGHRLTKSFQHVDKFLENFIPQARTDVIPVLNRTLTLTKQMKEKSQFAYQDAFQEAIGAKKLKANSNELLKRIRIFYDAGVSLRERLDDMKAVDQLSDNLHPFEPQCKETGLGDAKCKSHTSMINSTKEGIASLKLFWRRTRILESVKNMTEFLSGLSTTLKTAGKTPDDQERMKNEKMRVSLEFNHNISSVFNRELNSTAFVVGSLNSKLDNLSDTIDSARIKLANVSVKAKTSFFAVAPKYEKIRFAATLIILLLLLVVLVYVATSSSVVLFLPNTASKRQNWLVSSVYCSYIVYALVLCFVFCLFGVTSIMETEVCRYLAEEQPTTGYSTIDRFVVPEVNKVITLIKRRNRNDPNKTDMIPLKGLGRLFGGIQSGCQKNEPLLVALNSVHLIDTSVGDSSAASVAFKMKGRDILEREMMKANLDVLRDPKLDENMASLRGMVEHHAKKDFIGMVHSLANHNESIRNLLMKFEELKPLNDEVGNALKPSQQLAKSVAEGNGKSILESIAILQRADAYINDFAQNFTQMENIKDMASVIDKIRDANRQMTVYLLNQTLWTETAVEYYTKYVIEGSTEESNEIAKSTTVGFLSVVAKCRSIYDFYQSSTGIPCQTLLYPLAILWFTLGWCVFAGIIFSLFSHLSIVCFAKQPTARQSGAAGGLSSKYRNAEDQFRMEVKRQGDASETLLTSNAQTDGKIV